MVVVGPRHVPRAGKPARRSTGTLRGHADAQRAFSLPSHPKLRTLPHPTPASANGPHAARDRPEQSVAAVGLDLVLRVAPGLTLTPWAVVAAPRLQLRQRPRLAQPPRSGGGGGALTVWPRRRAEPVARRSSTRHTHPFPSTMVLLYVLCADPARVRRLRLCRSTKRRRRHSVPTITPRSRDAAAAERPTIRCEIPLPVPARSWHPAPALLLDITRSANTVSRTW
eukprot:COSAG04_NODE_265_length_18593_cov_4.226776_2_plen_225_part_00